MVKKEYPNYKKLFIMEALFYPYEAQNPERDE